MKTLCLCLILLPRLCWGLVIPLSQGMHVDAAFVLPATQPSAAAALASTQWEAIAPGKLPAKLTDFWYRVDVTLAEQGQGDTLFTGMLGSYRLYWDGELLFESGTPAAQAAAEKPGKLDNLIPVAASLRTPGPHQLLLQISRHHLTGELSIHHTLDLALVDGNHYQQSRLLAALLPLISLGGMLFIALYFCLLWCLERRAETLTFAVLCLALACLLIAETWRPLLGYTYDWHWPRLLVVGVLTILVSVALTAFLMLEYGFRRTFMVASVLALSHTALLVLSPNFDVSALVTLVTGLVTALGLSLVAVLRGDTKAWPVLLSSLIMVVVVALSPRYFFETWFFVAIDLFIVAMLLRNHLHYRTVQQQHQQMLVKAEALKAQLVRQYISPHFLMNTLTCLSEWIEEDPSVANRLIEALAEQFRLMNSVLDQPHISIADEIALVRSHLGVMALRQGRQYHLVVDSPAPTMRIPPATLLTLVENAFSHNRYRGDVGFSLQTSQSAARNSLHFRAPVTEAKAHQGAGIGMAYLHNRFDALYGQHWSLEEVLDETRWEIHLSFPQ